MKIKPGEDHRYEPNLRATVVSEETWGKAKIATIMKLRHQPKIRLLH